MNSTGIFQINFVRWGLIMGGILVLITIFIYTLLGPDYPVRHSIINWLYLIIMVSIIVIGIKSKKVNQGGYISYGKSFLEGLLIFSIAISLSVLFDSIYFHLISPESIDIVIQAKIEVTEKWMENGNASSKDINKAIHEIEIQDYSFSIFSELFKLLLSIIFGAFLTAIVSFFTRKKRPMFDA